MPQHATFFIARLLLMMIMASSTNGSSIKKRDTNPDYSPCTSEYSETEGLTVDCIQVPISNIKATFSQRAARDLTLLTLRVAPTETSPIPVDFLGASRTNRLNILCKGTSPYLIIDENAFRSSKNYTTSVLIENCDLKKQLNFAFLNDLQQLRAIIIRNSKNFNSFQGIPSHPQLEHIAIWDSRGFKSLAANHSKIALPGLKQIYLIGNELDDDTTAKLLKIFAESSTKTLRELKIDHNNLTRVPDMAKSFSNLVELRLENNLINKVSAKSLALPGLVSTLFLEGNSLSVIEPDAFGEGDYKIVNLKRNKLERIDPFVFQFMLEGMFKGLTKRGRGAAALELYGNPIRCDCHLAWLVVYKSHLLSAIDGGICSNSTLIANLNPDGFNHCPSFTCPAGIGGKFRNPLTCSSYYTCTAGKSVLTKCPAARVFNPDTQLCDVLKNVPTC